MLFESVHIRNMTLFLLITPKPSYLSTIRRNEDEANQNPRSPNPTNELSTTSQMATSFHKALSTLRTSPQEIVGIFWAICILSSMRLGVLFLTLLVGGRMRAMLQKTHFPITFPHMHGFHCHSPRSYNECSPYTPFQAPS